ncbi:MULTISPECIES: crotonase/enoyl-CoA hydratase family protein [unclassified Sphingomonas]|uniref:crotonase/enoyl-CoA hydratase family protein n=1 Tax=unclassified Sphingomonas TaxID=196159 RepID=UPI0006FF0991|nr:MULTISPECIES: crotonase/enoyl-CoA hydratase family protein [unclassified Sphingomonas]KQM27707.1 enoyl-CoA hydratase [Sphingomonas sp. Leaf9]KQM44046.1 enoyl-CoA hydratase [Sphingomonas sp. Leaf11]
MTRVTISTVDGVAEVRLARADKMNAIDPAMFDALIDAIDTLRVSSARCVVLSGEGRAFCAGLDMASMAGGAAGLDLATRSHGIANWVQQVAWGWRTLPMPVIAAVQGLAFGGGMQIMAGADVRIAAPDTRFAILEAKWGLVADMAGFALWRDVRGDLLRELAFSAREFTAEEALRAGFVTRLADDPHGAAMVLARAIAARSPDAVRAAKRIANLADDADAATILAAESAEQQALLGTPNQVEAVRAGMEKRAPNFTD